MVRAGRHRVRVTTEEDVDPFAVLPVPSESKPRDKSSTKYAALLSPKSKPPPKPPTAAKAPSTPDPGPIKATTEASLEVVSPAPKEDKKVELSEEQKKLLYAVKKGESLFFTGAAGCGKSAMLRAIVDALPSGPSTVVTASTGIAACNIGGQTLHSFAGLPRLWKSAEDAAAAVARKTEAMRRWRSVRTLIVDEISMVDISTFEAVDAVARMARNNQKPFGGVQLVLCGDFFQLPPVAKGFKVDDSKPRFCFESKVWPRAVPRCVELTKVFRQTDSHLVRALNQLRRGVCDEETKELFASRVRATMDRSDGVLPTRLCTHRVDVDAINNVELRNLDGAGTVFSSLDVPSAAFRPSSKWDASAEDAVRATLDRYTPARHKLVLKVGAQVMCLRNLDPERGLVNGARGVVVGFNGARKTPKVKMASGETVQFEPVEWQARVGGRILATRRQLPLDLAFAVSVHRSQGMTLDRVQVSLGRVFEYGQAYVALSRARSLQGLYLQDPFDPTCARAHPAVLQFDRNHFHPDLPLPPSKPSLPTSPPKKQQPPPLKTPTKKKPIVLGERKLNRKTLRRTAFSPDSKPKDTTHRSPPLKKKM